MEEYIHISDEKLVEIIRSKDKELYAHILKRYQEKLMRYAVYLTGDDDKAADAVQETFIKAYKNLNGFNSKLKFSSWLYRIAHNESINIIKKNHRDVPIDAGINIASGQNIEGEYDKKEIIEMAHKCLSKMPLIYSEPLALFFLEEKSYEEISDILRIPMGTVATRINRAKSLMKQICQKQK